MRFLTDLKGIGVDKDTLGSRVRLKDLHSILADNVRLLDVGIRLCSGRSVCVRIQERIP